MNLIKRLTMRTLWFTLCFIGFLFLAQPSLVHAQSVVLDPTRKPLCSDIEGIAEIIDKQTWEQGLPPINWITGTRNISTSFNTPNWQIVDDLPAGVPDGSQYAAFAANPNTGCSDADQAGVRYLESPPINIPADANPPRLAFDHWIATEARKDGGNVKYCILNPTQTNCNKDSDFSIVPEGNFIENGYNVNNLEDNSNPMAGEAAFSGTNEGSNSGNWGQSRINLTGIGAAGHTIKFRFEMGQNKCGGVTGWYVTNIRTYYCRAPRPAMLSAGPANVLLVLNPDEVVTTTLTITNSGELPLNWEFVGTNQTSQELPRAVENLLRSDPLRKGSLVMFDNYSKPQIELGTAGDENSVKNGNLELSPPGVHWNASSTNFTTPICNQFSCGSGGSKGPYEGEFWAWFGGVLVNEVAHLTQTITIPDLGESASMELHFYLELPACDNEDNDYLEVVIYETSNHEEATQVFKINSTDKEVLEKRCGVSGYRLEKVDLSSEWKGKEVVIDFHANFESNNSDVTNFFVDAITLEVVNNCVLPDTVDWLDVSPSNGIVAANSSIPITVTLNASSALSSGMYAATLCIQDKEKKSISPIAIHTKMLVKDSAANEPLICNGGKVTFDGGIPQDWESADYIEGGIPWGNNLTYDLANYTGGSEGAASASSDFHRAVPFDTKLVSPPIDLTGYTTIMLNYKANYQNWENIDFLDLDISIDEGNVWTTLLRWNENQGFFKEIPGSSVSIDLSQYKDNEKVRLRWRYYDPRSDDGIPENDSEIWDWYVQIDDVELICSNIDINLGKAPEVGVEALSVLQALNTQRSEVLTIINDSDAELRWSITAATQKKNEIGQEATTTTINSITNQPQRLGPTIKPAVLTKQMQDAIVSLQDNIVVDGGFEAGPFSGFWTESSIYFSTPICDLISCGHGNGTGPHSGQYWAWFGGSLGQEEAEISQTITITKRAVAELQFYLEQPVCDTQEDYLEVLVDGERVFRVTGDSPYCGEVGYRVQRVDVSKWADGAAHTITFRSENFDRNDGASNFFVDDVTLETDSICAKPGENLPSWLAILPPDGIIEVNGSTPVTVTFTTINLSPGVYDATLCVKNVRNNKLTEVPVKLITAARPFADLEVSDNHTKDPVTQGEHIEHQVVVTNNGLDVAGDVVLTDNLPIGTAFVSAFPASVTCSDNNGIVTCNLGNIESNGRVDVVITLATNDSTPRLVSNIVEVKSITSDPNPANNIANEDTIVNVIVRNLVYLPIVLR